ncbi:MAG: M42 family peptidase, partial [Candidatus Latescibacteria bacterium]|nr:M42 family peptidase [Candidatus Latescibacterota bacterium]
MSRNGAPRFDEVILETISNAPGVSGGEEAIRSYLAGHVRDWVDSLEVDPMGSLVGRIGPAKAARGGRRGPHVMLCAHMDEVGLMVTAVEKEGRLRFRRVGGIDPRILPGQVFRIGPQGIRGVVGALPPHLVPRAERENVTPAEDLYLDIGARSREEAEERVSVGEYAAFDTRYESWGSVRKGKAFDDRVGCAVLASVIRRRPPVPVTAVWSVQEEVGLRGAAAAARRVAPDLAIVLEGTASGEAPGTPREEQYPCMGRGPALTIQDRSLMAHARLLETIRSVGK